jgi:hypothetical protein
VIPLFSYVLNPESSILMVSGRQRLRDLLQLRSIGRRLLPHDWCVADGDQAELVLRRNGISERDDAGRCVFPG